MHDNTLPLVRLILYLSEESYWDQFDRNIEKLMARVEFRTHDFYDLQQILKSQLLRMV